MAITTFNPQSNTVNLSKAAKIGLLKSAQKNQSLAKTQPLVFSKQGSIFFAPGLNNNKTTNQPDLNKQNIYQSLNLLNNNKKTDTQNSSSKMSNEDITNIDNASDGKKAANQINKQQESVKAYTTQTQQDAQTVNKLSSQATKLDKKIEKSDKKFAQSLEKQQAAFKKDNDNLAKLAKETEETQKEVDNAQRELESLNANNKDGQNSAKISELQTLIGSKVGILQQNGKAIYSLQRSQSRIITSMNKTNRQYVKTQKRNKKTIQNQQSTNDKIVKVATKIEQVSSLVEQGGKALSLAGKGLIALGSTMSIAGGAGAALIAAGKIMDKVGTVAQMVGQYGQAAANITKTAAYAADGNLMGAMQSATAAFQSGSAAIKSTTGLKESFGQINNSAKEATEKLNANIDAKNIVNDKQNEAIKNIATDDQIEKFTKNGQLDYKSLEKDMKNNGVDVKQVKSDALGGAKAKEARKFVSDSILNNKETATDAFDKGIDKGFKTAAKETAKTAKKSGSSVTSTLEKVFSKMGTLSSMQSSPMLASALGNGNVQFTGKKPKRQPRDFSYMLNTQQFQNIQNSRLRHQI